MHDGCDAEGLELGQPAVMVECRKVSQQDMNVDLLLLNQPEGQVRNPKISFFARQPPL